MYDITRGQLRTLWVTGVIVWLLSALFALDSYGGDIWTFLVIAIFPALIFYTIGWRSNNKKIKEEKSEDEN